MKASLPQGVRDFLPEQVYKRTYIFDIIKNVFELYGYAPIETPVMENLSTLTGKYGEEGDRLLFKILNNGDYLSKVDLQLLVDKKSADVLPMISKRGLRYDLTVPFARFVSMHLHKLATPFKRYQIQPVWRADRPQKGRFREFYQCDVDVVGSASLVYEAELLQIYDQVFAQLNIEVVIKVNHRKILQGLVDKLGLDSGTALIIIIDKLDKIGIEGVLRELSGIGLSEEQIFIVQAYLDADSLADVSQLLKDTSAQLGVKELQIVFDFLEAYAPAHQILFDPKLARGLDYYTGCIMEVIDPKAQIGSLGGGGRYDNLTEVFGVKNMSGVGVSFGAERIYHLMEERNLFPTDLDSNPECIILYDVEPAQASAFRLLTQLRSAQVKSVMYPEATKLKKQFKYAERLGIPYAVIIGQTELDAGCYTLKNLNNRDQQSLRAIELIDYLKAKK